MSRFPLVLWAALACAGCVQSGPPADPKSPDRPAPIVLPDKPAPVVSGDSAQLYLALARALDRGKFTDADHFLLSASKAREALGLPPGGDAVNAALGDLLKGGAEPFTDDLRKRIAQKLRALAEKP